MLWVLSSVSVANNYPSNIRSFGLVDLARAYLSTGRRNGRRPATAVGPSWGVKMRIEQLSASGEGPNRGLALAALAADARTRSNQVLADPMSTADLRDAALLVWISDCAGGLTRLVEAGV